MEESETNERLKTFIVIRENVVASLMLTLNNLLHTFRANQSLYLKQLDLRTQNVDAFVLASKSSNSSTLNWNDSGVLFGDSLNSDYLTMTENEVPEDELSITQIQQIMQNEHMSKEREKEVNIIS